MRLLRWICALCLVSVLFGQEKPAQEKPDQAKPKLDLHGDPFPGLKYEELTPAQEVIADRAIASRGTIGIFNIELRSPELTTTGLKPVESITTESRTGTAEAVWKAPG